jgi:hypothetical protein
VLRPVRDALGRRIDLSHVELRTIARALEHAKDDVLDEVRLACAPIDRTPGLRALELALAVAAPGPHGAIPEVLVRFDDGSPAAARIASLARGARPVPGRTPDEKVVRLAPEEPTADASARLLAGLLADLEGRRATDRISGNEPSRTTHTRPGGGPERRAPQARAKAPGKAPGRAATAATAEAR